MSPATTAQLEAGLPHVLEAPATDGRLDLVVTRPGVGLREVNARGTLDPAEGLIRDSWRTRGSRHTADGSAESGRQLTLMNSRAIALFAGPDHEQWALAGDQLYVDLDLSEVNVPAGTRLTIGPAVVEVSPLPHTGCAKFTQRFGLDASRLANSTQGLALHLRGINAFVLEAGPIAVGDPVRRLR